MSNETVPDSGTTFFDSTPSTAQETPDSSDSILQLLQGGSSTLQPIEFDDESTRFNGTAIQKTMHKINNLFDAHPWLLWVFLGVLLLIVIFVITLIIVCIIKQKKRVILSQTTDQDLVDYEQGGKFSLLCCRKKRDENKDLIRQNSASNLDPYKRAPLPPIGAQNEKQDGVFTIRSNNNLDHNANQPINAGTLGIQITSIKGVPVIDIPKDQYRPLPGLRNPRQ